MRPFWATISHKAGGAIGSASGSGPAEGGSSPADSNLFPIVPSFQLSGRPDPEVEWLHNGEKLHVDSDSRVSVSLSSGRAVLRIAGAAAADAGEYCCQATNAAGMQVSKATLTVGGAEPRVNGTVPEMDGLAAPPAAEADSTAAAVDAAAALRLAKDLESKVVEEKTEVTLQCQLEGAVFGHCWNRLDPFGRFHLEGFIEKVHFRCFRHAQ